MLTTAEGSLFVTFRDMVDRILDLPGSRYSCVAVTGSGEIVAEAGEAVVESVSMLRWGREASAVLEGPSGGGMEDLILTSGRHYHLVRPLGGTRSMLLYLCVDRARVNLAVARRELAAVRPDTAARPQVPPSPVVSRTAAAMPPASRLPAAEPVEVPLPRRSGSTWPGARTVPPAQRPNVAPILRQDWVDDVATMNRLLVALRELSGRGD
jgi:hypothetical protein